MQTVRQTLGRLAIRPSRRLGQNFLVDGNWIRKAVASVPAGRMVVEIGPGTGALTAPLLDRGHPVRAIEIDGRLCAALRERFRDRDFALVEGDAVDQPLAGAEAARDGFALLANLPFAITSPWLDALLRPGRPLPDPLLLILQKEGWERATAATATKAYGPTAIRMHLAYEPVAADPVPRRAFYPPPEIESRFACWRLRPRPVLFPPETVETLRGIFGRRRKMLRQTLKTLGPSEAARWTRILARHGLDPASRPEQLPPEAWAAILLHRLPNPRDADG